VTKLHFHLLRNCIFQPLRWLPSRVSLKLKEVLSILSDSHCRSITYHLSALCLFDTKTYQPQNDILLKSSIRKRADIYDVLDNMYVIEMMMCGDVWGK